MKKPANLAIKLNCLKDKEAKFESHKSYLSRYINDVLQPKELELMPEPIIGNHYQFFLDNWYSSKKQFALSLLKNIDQFCGKTMTITINKINKRESYLSANANQGQFKGIKSIHNSK